MSTVEKENLALLLTLHTEPAKLPEMFRHISEILTLIASAIVQFLLYRNSISKDFTPKRILVIKLDHIGDVLLSTPCFFKSEEDLPRLRNTCSHRKMESSNS